MNKEANEILVVYTDPLQLFDIMRKEICHLMCESCSIRHGKKADVKKLSMIEKNISRIIERIAMEYMGEMTLCHYMRSADCYLIWNLIGIRHGENPDPDKLSNIAEDMNRFVDIFEKTVSAE